MGDLRSGKGKGAAEKGNRSPKHLEGQAFKKKERRKKERVSLCCIKMRLKRVN